MRAVPVRIEERITGVTLLALGLCLGLCLCPMAQAQINPFKSYNGPILSKADLDAGQEAAIRLLGSTPPPVGATERWVGPKSGNHGILTVEKAYRQKDRDCRAVRSEVDYKAGKKRSTLLHTCRIDGEWKLM